jgi:hypothetical protein
VLHEGVFHLYAPDNGTRLGPPPRPPGERRERVEARPGEPGEERRREEGERARDGVGYHATSKDGLAFTRADDVKIEGRRHWLGGVISDGKVMTFYGTGESAPEPGGRPRGGVWVATSKDGQTWKAVAGPAIPGADPGAVKGKDGGLVVVGTTGSVRSVQAPVRGR